MKDETAYSYTDCNRISVYVPCAARQDIIDEAGVPETERTPIASSEEVEDRTIMQVN